jgi:REP element-mobilizing transposase RayT
MRYEHWLVDNQVYFITARCRDRLPAFALASAKAVFWDRFEHYTSQFGFAPWITTLLDNHYHTLGYLSVGTNLPAMMQRVYGSVAKLVNDILAGEPASDFGELSRAAGVSSRHVPFWRDAKGHEYFDGCIRDEKQARLAYRYTQLQAVRHGVVTDWRAYAHTRTRVAIDVAVARAHELGAFLEGVPYKRYVDGRKGGPGPAR